MFFWISAYLGRYAYQKSYFSGSVLHCLIFYSFISIVKLQNKKLHFKNFKFTLSNCDTTKSSHQKQSVCTTWTYWLALRTLPTKIGNLLNSCFNSPSVISEYSLHLFFVIQSRPITGSSVKNLTKIEKFKYNHKLEIW